MQYLTKYIQLLNESSYEHKILDRIRDFKKRHPAYKQYTMESPSDIDKLIYNDKLKAEVGMNDREEEELESISDEWWEVLDDEETNYSGNKDDVIPKILSNEFTTVVDKNDIKDISFKVKMREGKVYSIRMEDIDVALGGMYVYLTRTSFAKGGYGNSVTLDDIVEYLRANGGVEIKKEKRRRSQAPLYD